MPLRQSSSKSSSPDPAAAALRAMEGESQNQRTKRVEELWRRLDPRGDRELDLKGLKKGLRRIDHPMKNADDMLREIIDIVDVNGDGKIQFEEFRVFVEAAERQLLLLFRSIDRNHDGRLNKAELRAAFQKSGLAVPSRRLDGFFDEIDMNHDGYITFDEWRDFLLFVPTKGSDSPLETALSYYASIVILNAEGDSMVSDETLEGLGTTTGSLLQALFGSILKLAKPSIGNGNNGNTAVSSRSEEEEEEMPPVAKTTSMLEQIEIEEQPPLQVRKRRRTRSPERFNAASSFSTSDSIPPVPSSPTAPSPPPPPLPPDAKERKTKEKEGAVSHESETGVMSSAAASDSTPVSKTETLEAKRAANAADVAAIIKAGNDPDLAAGRGHEYEDFEDLDDVDELDEVLDSGKATGSGTKLQRAQRVAGSSSSTKTKRKSKYKQLTQYVPHPGYFLAGALAGGISRTATAPFDRLKVYLLVNTRGGSTGTKAAAAAATAPGATTGELAAANLRKTGRPIRDAIVNLYRAGGLRTFFAGNGLNVVKIMPETAIKFGSYEAAKRTLAAFEGHGDPLRINSSSKFVAGGVAGMIAQFCVYPLDTLKFRLQCETVQGGPTGNALLMQTARRMYETGGFRAAYRGVTMGLIGMFPYSAIDMGTFELLKSTYMKYKARYYGIHEEDAMPGNVVTGIIGATSGAFGATVVYPLNVLRTRLQTQGTVMHPPTYTGIWDVATRTLSNEGVRGLYKGLTPNLLKVAPALSITWVVYENSKKALGLP
ncbi:hypothetical protein Sste5346_003762 [Sporothrix stenoceras]|uniref:Mitochondrial thiamine pyrophosphate carrier 1 n=1 Tax=Sporothrix stenoceras TaxID=5173 RepID=A0ABR3ZB62_9PEZI